MCALFQQFRVTDCNGTQFFRREIRVTEHTLETVHVDVRDVADHEDGLLYFTSVTDKVLDFAQAVIILLALFVNLHGLLKIVEHIARGGRRVNDVLGGIDDALCKIAGVAYDPLRFRCEADEEAAHTQHEDFLFHDVSVLIGE